jgi:hypothetical protein
MMAIRVELESAEWQAVLTLMARAPYQEVAGLISKVVQQVQLGQLPLKPNSEAERPQVS